MRTSLASVFSLFALSFGALAQEGALPPDGSAAAPAWLSESLLLPHADIATSALPSQITVMPIGAVRLDAVGLLSATQTGLPRDLWADSDPAALATLFRTQPTDGLPAIMAFTQQLALAELDPPQASGPEAELFLARLDLLLARGALDPARALMERAGPNAPQVFRRWFDVSLLTGRAARACAAMRANPDIAPSFPARIFCLARGGDWSAAALSLGTGEALGFIPPEEAALIARFLDPDLFEGEPPLPPDTATTPLHYQMRAAIGERPASNGLPLAFSHADLADIAGWRAQLDAAERLLRSGAITAEQWQALYTSRVPAASGGIWDRVAALQAFDVALLAGDPEAVARTLPPVWDAMRAVRLEVPFAQLYAERLLRLPLTGPEAVLARRIGLLTSRYETVARNAVPQTAEERLLFTIARGQVPDTAGTTQQAIAVIGAFADTTAPERYTWLLQRERIGEALMRASLLIAEPGSDSDDLQDALRLFRAMGLEDVARRAALQLLILERQ